MPFLFAILFALTLVISACHSAKTIPTAPAPTVETIPQIPVITQLSPSQKNQTIAEKKLHFIQVVLPIVEHQNKVISLQRKRLLRLRYPSISNDDLVWLRALIKQYRVNDELPLNEQLQLLRLRVDEIPVNLAISQGAIESAWGQSRFALDGNNLFGGHWCYTPGCGLVPSRRPAGMKHEVKRFPSVNASINAYINNLNTHRAYKQMRIRRSSLRNQGLPLSPSSLAQELTHYSELGSAYVESLQRIISTNQALIKSSQPSN